jgi:hypothetical protein
LAKEFVEKLLTPHLKSVQLRQGKFMWDVTLRRDFARETAIGSWLFAILDDQLLEAAIRELPDIGVSEKDRQANLAHIDKEIKTLSEELEKLLD